MVTTPVNKQGQEQLCSGTSVPILFSRRFTMRRGWEVEYSDGRKIKESDMDWRKIPRDGIARVTLHYDGRSWFIKDKAAYLQKKRASMVPGQSDTFRVESRSIGYYDVVDGENVKVWYTVDEATGRMNMEVQKI